MAVLKLLSLHDLQFFMVFRSEVKGVETKITRGVIIAEKTSLGNEDILGLYPSNFGTRLFGGANGNGQEDP